MSEPSKNAVIDMLRDLGFECYDRSQWGSNQERAGAYARRAHTHPMPNGPAKYHFLHISVTTDTDTVKEGAAGAQQIERYGYSIPPMVSYQDLVTNEAKYFQGQDYGTKGTHTMNDKNLAGFSENLNYDGYACALMQNVQDAVTDDQVVLVAWIFAVREYVGFVKVGAPVYPHRKFAYKSCPGDRAMDRLPDIEKLKNKLVQELLSGKKKKKMTEEEAQMLKDLHDLFFTAEDVVEANGTKKKRSLSQLILETWKARKG